MSNLETKDFSFEVKAGNDFVFEGYASVFNNIDSHRDYITPGAFTKTIQESKRVKVLWQHDPYQPIGKPIVMSEDSKGLYVKAQISQTEQGKEAFQLIKDGVIDELSIGFNTVKSDWDNEKNARAIKEIRLWEFSPVTFASNELANITGAKNQFSLERLTHLLNEEFKAGQMLSAKNKELVLKAIESLQALVSASEGKGEPFHNTHIVKKEDEQAVLEIQNIIVEMQKYTKNRG
jgi:hypothetical protein